MSRESNLPSHNWDITPKPPKYTFLLLDYMQTTYLTTIKEVPSILPHLILSLFIFSFFLLRASTSSSLLLIFFFFPSLFYLFSSLLFSSLIIIFSSCFLSSLHISLSSLSSSVPHFFLLSPSFQQRGREWPEHGMEARERRRWDDSGGVVKSEQGSRIDEGAMDV